ncbi:hypothetical protein [Burkholderia sp. Ac-20365]|uniref:hypothetical protein n=1 Tax=Burkholderia sp. Ac-20365 TaxID=2703897 RepID=UPI00197C631C|nr:hypothetical protein [Burkholderia sp. Ac-20365]MBN3761094.1 hypothetical protein [Burkholderia sp. Ac-20365]
MSACQGAAPGQNVTFGPDTRIANQREDRGYTVYMFFPVHGPYYEEAGYAGDEYAYQCTVQDGTGNVVYTFTFDYWFAVGQGSGSGG